MIGLFRGFVAEAFSLLTWVFACWVAFAFSPELSIFFQSSISLPSARIALAFVVLFLLTLILGSILRFILGQLVNSTGLTGSDRFAGLIFGIGRGILVVGILVMLAGLTPLPQDPWWRESNLISPFQSGALWLKEQLPSGIAGKIHYR